MYQKAKSVPEMSRRGQFIADAAGHRMISASFPRAYNLRDAAGKAKTLADLIALCRSRGYHFETVYEAAHGRRYVAIVFQYSASGNPDMRQRENTGARKMAFDFLTAPDSERYQSHAP
jgi:hypothetical protein